MLVCMAVDNCTVKALLNESQNVCGQGDLPTSDTSAPYVERP